MTDEKTNETVSAEEEKKDPNANKINNQSHGFSPEHYRYCCQHRGLPAAIAI